MRRLRFLFFLPLLAAHCNKNVLDDPETPTVKLLASLNNNNGIIHLNDTLKFTLQVPDSIVVIPKLTGVPYSQPVNSLQTCMYNFTFYKVDTITKHVERITDVGHAFVTTGQLYRDASVYTTTGKPYVSCLNVIPPSTGLYYVEFGRQETIIRYNSNQYAGLRVNVNVNDKHWVENARYFNSPVQPDFISSVSTLDADGYGFYVFRVD